MNLPRSLYRRSSYIPVYIVLSLGIILSQLHLHAAYDNHPPEISWRVIQTEHFNVVFSDDIETEANRVANLLEHYLTLNRKTMPSEWRKTTVVLISESATANGYVTSLPYMSAFYNTPATFSATEWYRTLAVHEGRHMLQMNTINSEGRKINWYIFGDQGATVYRALTVPSWVLEGDAVLAETTLTHGGRGRTPVFDMYVRTNELSRQPEKRYNYYRAYMGSYEDNYPVANHYVLGYHMAAYGRIKYGPMIWHDTFRSMGETTLLPDHFDSAFKKQTSDNSTMVEHYRETYNYLRHKWGEQLSGLEFTRSETVTETDSRRWNAFLQLQETNGSLYCIQSGKDHVTGITRLQPGKKNRFVKQIPHSRGTGAAGKNERSFSVGIGKAVWVEEVADIRWGKRSYSSIRVLDLETGATKRLFPQGRMISASISEDGRHIAAVEFTTKRECFLHIVDSTSGTSIRRIESPDNVYLFDTTWSDDSSSIACAALSKEGSALLLFNTQSGDFTELIPFTHKEHPKTPSFAGRHLLYESDYSGINNIYAFDLRSGKRYQVTSRKYGAFYPAVSEDGTTIYYSDYTIKGYSGEKMEMDPASWTPLAQVPVRRPDLYTPVAKQEAGEPVSQDIDGKKYQSRNYSPLMNTVHIHSWNPVFGYYFGFGLHSNDYLNTTAISLAYNYNINEEAHSVTGSLQYSGLYPVLETGGVRGQRGKTDSDGNNIAWEESSGYISATLPFDFSRGIHSTTFEVSSTVSYTGISGKSQAEREIHIIDDGIIMPIEYTAAFSHTTESAPLDIYPRWGQFVSGYYSHIPYGDYAASQTALLSRWFFPSVFTHHSLHFQLNYEHDTGDEYRFPLRFLYPRGYSPETTDHIVKGSANYTLPLLNMHLPLWKVLYFKRISATGFYDFGYIQADDGGDYRRSAGGEMVLTYHPFSNKGMLLDSGIEYAYRFEDNTYAYRYILFRISGTF